MNRMKKILNYSILFICSLFTVSCEIDNYEGPDCTIKGTIYDHLNRPLQVNQGAGIIRMREISWAKDSASYIGNRTLLVQQDGTYQHTKWFSGTYRMLPRAGAFYPYDDENQDLDDAGELVEISGTTTKDFSVTPYLTIEWVKKPVVTSDNYVECSVRFTRNQKAGYEMPDVKEAWLLVSRSVNTSARWLDLYPVSLKLTNDMEGQELNFRTSIPVKYTGIDYWIRVSMSCQTAAGKPETNYPGMGSDNFTTIEKIHVP
jgi:hypothetical protein